MGEQRGHVPGSAGWPALVGDCFDALPEGPFGKGGGALSPCSELAIAVLTGGTEQRVVRAAATRPVQEPVVVAHPWHNSLAAALEAMARLHQDGRPGRIVYLDGNRTGRTALAEAIHDVDVARRLRRLRIGAVGTPSDWLVASSPTPGAVRDAWGPEVVAIDIAEALAANEGTAADAGAALASAMVDGATAVKKPDGPGDRGRRAGAPGAGGPGTAAPPRRADGALLRSGQPARHEWLPRARRAQRRRCDGRLRRRSAQYGGDGMDADAAR